MILLRLPVAEVAKTFGGDVLPERRCSTDQSLGGFGYRRFGGDVLPERRCSTDQSLGGFGYRRFGGDVLPERRCSTNQSLGRLRLPEVWWRRSAGTPL